jgi:hypothetical protein
MMADTGAISLQTVVAVLRRVQRSQVWLRDEDGEVLIQCDCEFNKDEMALIRAVRAKTWVGNGAAGGSGGRA